MGGGGEQEEGAIHLSRLSADLSATCRVGARATGRAACRPTPDAGTVTPAMINRLRRGRLMIGCDWGRGQGGRWGGGEKEGMEELVCVWGGGGGDAGSPQLTSPSCTSVSGNS